VHSKRNFLRQLVACGAASALRVLYLPCTHSRLLFPFSLPPPPVHKEKTIEDLVDDQRAKLAALGIQGALMCVCVCVCVYECVYEYVYVCVCACSQV